MDDDENVAVRDSMAADLRWGRWLIARGVIRGGRGEINKHQFGQDPALDALRNRLASGELDEAEYSERRRVVRFDGGGGTPHPRRKLTKPVVADREDSWVIIWVGETYPGWHVVGALLTVIA